MGSYMCVMQLWRKKQSHLVGVLPKISRAFQTQKTNSDQLLGMVKSGVARQCTAHSSLLTRGIVGADAISVLSGRKFTRELNNATWTPLQLRRNYGANNVVVPRFSRTMSRPPRNPRRNRSETKSDIITVEDPIDAITYNVPQKPLTFVEGASYSVAILVGLGIAIACYYAVYEGLILKPNEYQIFNMALKRIQDDAKVRKKVGYPIIGYGDESRNRVVRQHIPNKFWTDEDGVEHVVVNFCVRGSQGAGKVYTEMFKDSDKNWKYKYLVVETISPSKSLLILESNSLLTSFLLYLWKTIAYW